MGIRTLADLRGWQRPALEDRFGPRSGAWLHARGNLLDETPVIPEHETKSQSTEITFDVDVNQRAELERHLAELSEELCRRLRKRELDGRTIGIKIRLDDWTNVTRSHTVEEPTNDPAVVGPSPSTCCAPTTRSGRCACSASASPPSRRGEAPSRAGADTRSAPSSASLPESLAARHHACRRREAELAP